MKAGDNLTKIAKANGLTVKELLALNPGITNPNKIRTGQKINVQPSGGSGNTRGEGFYNAADQWVSEEGATSEEKQYPGYPGKFLRGAMQQYDEEMASENVPEFSDANDLSPVKPPFTNPTGLKMRNDAGGLGHFGASRLNKDGTRRLHTGLDISTTNGQDIVAPFDGTAVNYYGTEFKHPYVKITPSSNVNTYGIDNVKMIYVNPLLSNNQKIHKSGTRYRVTNGQPIGTAANLQKQFRYPTNVTPHVHIKVQSKNTLVDPAPFYFNKGN